MADPALAAAPATAASSRARTAAAPLAVVLVALTLRGPVSSVGPLLGDLRSSTGLPSVAAALLTSLPLVCFGLVSPVAPLVAHRLGLHRGVLAGAVLVAAGLAVRAGGVPGLLVGTVLVGCGIAAGNVLLPAVVKADFGARAAAMTGVVTASMALSATLGAGLAQPLRGLLGGPVPSLVAWTLPGAVAVVGWLAFAPGRGAVPAPAHREAVLPLLRQPLARAVTAFFGLQSLTFYTALAWLPQVLVDDAHLSAAGAGGLLAVMAVLGIPVSLVVPRLAARRPGQGGWVVAASVPTLAALVGLLAAPAAAPVLWAVLLGIGTGASFPLALTLVVLRSRDSAQTAGLSAAAQGAGYLLAACGPVLAGLLHDVEHGWTAALAVLAALVVAQVAVGLRAGRAELLAR